MKSFFRPLAACCTCVLLAVALAGCDRLPQRDSGTTGDAISDAEFQRAVLDSDKPVLVDFYATWCPPCKAMMPIVEKLGDEYAGRLTVFKVNTDENPRLASRYVSEGIPTFVIFREGEPQPAIIGMVPEETLRAAIEKAI